MQQKLIRNGDEMRHLVEGLENSRAAEAGKSSEVTQKNVPLAAYLSALSYMHTHVLHMNEVSESCIANFRGDNNQAVGR